MASIYLLQSILKPWILFSSFSKGKKQPWLLARLSLVSTLQVRGAAVLVSFKQIYKSLSHVKTQLLHLGAEAALTSTSPFVQESEGCQAQISLCLQYKLRAHCFIKDKGFNKVVDSMIMSCWNCCQLGSNRNLGWQ